MTKSALRWAKPGTYTQPNVRKHSLGAVRTSKRASQNARTKTISFDMPYWLDLHAHFRQGKSTASYLAMHLSMGCAVIVAMPNTKPPVSRVKGRCTSKSWTITGYHKMLRDAGGDKFECIIVPLYLSKRTTPAMVRDAIKHGYRHFKLYPPGGTTNSDDAMPVSHYIRNGVLRAIEKGGGILQIHGEMPNSISNQNWFDQHRNSEIIFYRTIMPHLRKKFPRLRIVCEHITTRVAVNFVKKAGLLTAATIPPQYLLYTVGDLLKLFTPHLVCMPLVKFEADMLALRRAVTHPRNAQFFAGTDSAPHHKNMKQTDCGCAFGCYTGGYALQMYVMAFEAAGLNMSQPKNQHIFRRFMVYNGAAFYGLKLSTKRLRLVRESEAVIPALDTGEGEVISLAQGMSVDLKAKTFKPTTLPWRIEHLAA